MKTAGGYLLAATALIACPCHLILVLPVLLGLLSGTVLGAALAANTGLIIAAATVYFVGALGTGLYLLSRRTDKEASCPAPSFDQKPRISTTSPDRPVHVQGTAGARR